MGEKNLLQGARAHHLEPNVHGADLKGATLRRGVLSTLGPEAWSVYAPRTVADERDASSSGDWSRARVNLLKRIHGTRTDDDLARIFGCSAEQIRAQASARGLGKDKAFTRKLLGKGATWMPRWKSEDLELLEQSYAAVSNLELAQRLGRSVKSVLAKAHQVGLRKDHARLREMGRANVAARYQSSVGDPTSV